MTTQSRTRIARGTHPHELMLVNPRLVLLDNLGAEQKNPAPFYEVRVYAEHELH